MKKNIVETVKEYTTTVTRVYCDDCGTELRRTMACSVARCELCGADLCDKCVAEEERTMGDYREVYCKNCNEIRNEYLPEIQKHEDAIDNLYEHMKQRCKTVRSYPKSEGEKIKSASGHGDQHVS